MVTAVGTTIFASWSIGLGVAHGPFKFAAMNVVCLETYMPCLTVSSVPGIGYGFPLPLPLP